VLRAETGTAEIFIPDPPVIAKCEGDSLTEGGRVRVRLVSADATARKVTFERVLE